MNPDPPAYDRSTYSSYLCALSQEEYPHQHEILISISISKNPQQPCLTFIHHWDHTDPRLSIAMPSSVNPDNLRYVRGFQECGTFWLPDVQVFDIVGLHEYLTSCITGSHNSDPEKRTSILGGLDGKTTPVSGVDCVELFVVPVRGNRETSLVDEGKTLQWRWEKPESVYDNKMCSWQPDLVGTLGGGEWFGGKNLQLVVRSYERDKMCRRTREDEEEDREDVDEEVQRAWVELLLEHRPEES